MVSSTTQTDPAQTSAAAYENPKGILGKDDFMMLLLAQLQYQDPTEPTDTATILTQTSQLASLESAENTNTALENLSASLANSNQFGTIAAIGKTADLGSNAISYTEGSSSTFEVYFPEDVASGSIEVLDGEGNIVKTMETESGPAGIQQFTWDGTGTTGSFSDSGLYYVTGSYTNANGDALTTRLGTYPIESVKFEDANTLVKIGSNYVPLENVKEIY